MRHEVRRTAIFDAWLDGLNDSVAKDAICSRIVRLETGLLGDRKNVGAKIAELRIDVGPGDRVYYTAQDRAIVLLGGGTKQRQTSDIRKAEAMAKALIKEAKDASGGVRERQSAYATGAEAHEEFTFTKDELEVSPFDVADYLQRDSSQIHILRDAFESGHAGYIASAIGAVARARARGLTALESQTGIKRQTLNKSLSAKGNPTLETLTTVLKALGLRLEVVADLPRRAKRARKG